MYVCICVYVSLKYMYILKPIGSLRYASTDNNNDNKAPSKYSDTTKKLVFGLAKVMGYYSKGSTAIRTSHQLYNVCAEQMEKNKEFYTKGNNKYIRMMD